MRILVTIICYFAVLLLIALAHRKRKEKQFGCCILPGREPVAVVHRFLRNDWRQHIGSDVCFRAGDGAKYGYDIYANCLRILFRLSGGGARAASDVLPAQSDKYLQLSRHSDRCADLPYRRFLFSAFANARYGCQTLFGLSYSPHVCIRAYGHTFLGYCCRFGGAGMGLYTQEWYQNHCLDRHVADILPDSGIDFHYFILRYRSWIREMEE